MRMRGIVFLSLIMICGCASASVRQSDSLPIRTMHAAGAVTVYAVETGKYKGNYRLRLVMDRPREAVVDGGVNTMYIRLPADAAFRPEAAARLREQDSPCRYGSTSYSDNKMVITFNCAEDAKVYPEVVGERMLDLIISE